MGEEHPAEFQVIDKRHFADPDAVRSDVEIEEKPRYPTYVEELMARMAEMEKRFEEKKNQMIEEVSRTKTRLEADYRRVLELEKQKILKPFLDVLDNLDRALQAAAQPGNCDRLLEGVEMTGSLFRARLQALGVEALTLLDQPFDPNLCEAVGVVAVTDPSRDGAVVEEVQRGYRMGDQLLRPAQVRVGRYGTE
jgi:molecular chaperone GrpE (heat shock protein)